MPEKKVSKKKELLALQNTNKDGKFIKSFIAVGDVVEVEFLGEIGIYKVEKFEVVKNSSVPAEFVIHVEFSYNDGKSSIECTSKDFKFIRHILI